MRNDMLELYKQLSLDNQRNEFSSLLLKIDKLLDELLIKNNISNNTQVKNYDLNKGLTMSERDMLTFFYEDLWNLKNKILALLILDNK